MPQLDFLTARIDGVECMARRLAKSRGFKAELELDVGDCREDLPQSRSYGPINRFSLCTKFDGKMVFSVRFFSGETKFLIEGT